MVLPTPVAAYNFNGDANDEVGGNNGTINGATLTSGKVAWGYDFDGTNDEISIPYDALLQPSGSFSFSVLVKTGSDVTNQQWILNHRNSFAASWSAYALKLVNSNFRFQMEGNGVNSQQCISSVTISTNTWYHVVVTVTSGDVAHIYVDAVDNGAVRAIV